MAMRQSPASDQMLNRSATVTAALASIALAVAGLAAAVVCLRLYWQQTALAYAAVILGVVFLALAAGGVQLLRGLAWSQQLLLILWLAVAVASVTAILGMVLWAVPEAPAGAVAEDARQQHDSAVRQFTGQLIAAGVLLAASAAASALLARASAPGSRLRYFTTVAVSVAAAVAVLLVGNLIAQHKDSYFRADVQLLGRYGLSDRAVKIIQAVNEPIRLTSLYASADANAEAEQRAGRVWELLSETRELNGRIEIARADTDAARAKLYARLARQANERAPAHTQLLGDFLAEGEQLLEQLRGYQREWEGLSGTSYLNLWGAAARVATSLRGVARGVEETRGLVREQMGGLFDHADLAEQVRQSLADANTSLTSIRGLLATLGKIPPAAVANRARVFQQLDGAAESVRRSTALLGRPQDAAEPNDPSEVLKQYVAAMEKTVLAVGEAAQALDEVAGIENAGYVRQSSAWLIDTGEAPVVIGGIAVMARNNLTRAYLDLAEQLAQQRMIAEGILTAGTKEYQAKVIVEMRPALAQTVQATAELTAAAKKAIQAISTVDEPTAAIFQEVADGQYMQGALAMLSQGLQKADALPELKRGTLSEDIQKENILLVETASKAEVLTFDDVWRPRAGQGDSAGPEAAAARAFNGDSAVSSKVLAMTQSPYATVWLTHLAPPPQYGPMGGGQALISPQMLGELRGRLEQANLKVKEWDLSDEMPSDANDPNAPAEPTPEVLLVLPPPLPASPYGPPAVAPEAMERIRRAIDRGAGAIFLAQSLPRMRWQPALEYRWNEYLQADWGLTVQTEYVVVPAERDETGQRFKLLPLRFHYMPLSTYSDHPVGRPLQGDRTLWFMLCPIQTAQAPPAGVKVQPLLSVPASWTATWATSDVERIRRQIESPGGSFISPDYAGGDLRVPFDVAVAASRTGDPNAARAASRIVVLTMGASLVDDYLTQRITVLDERQMLSTYDPPRANADLVVNSVYWLCGREGHIAAGPVAVQPIRSIGRSTYRLLWVLCVIALPVAVVAVGAVVMLVRRR